MVARYWIAHGPLVLQLPPDFPTVLQSVVYHGPFELEFARWFFQYPGVSVFNTTENGSHSEVAAA
jgi:hypothetical protein